MSGGGPVCYRTTSSFCYYVSLALSLYFSIVLEGNSEAIHDEKTLLMKVKV